MAITLSVPARINILGNPADGNEGDFATISAAVDIQGDELVELWQKTAADNGLINAEVIKPVIGNDGLRIERQFYKRD